MVLHQSLILRKHLFLMPHNTTIILPLPHLRINRILMGSTCGLAINLIQNNYCYQFLISQFKENSN